MRYRLRRTGANRVERAVLTAEVDGSVAADCGRGFYFSISSERPLLCAVGIQRVQMVVPGADINCSVCADYRRADRALRFKTPPKLATTTDCVKMSAALAVV